MRNAFRQCLIVHVICRQGGNGFERIYDGVRVVSAWPQMITLLIPKNPLFVLLLQCFLLIDTDIRLGGDSFVGRFVYLIVLFLEPRRTSHIART